MNRIGMASSIAWIVVVAVAQGEPLAPATGPEPSPMIKALRASATSNGERRNGPLGHPTEEVLDAMIASALREQAQQAEPNPLFDPDDPPESPLVSGPFINFESPVTKGIVVSADGSRVYAVHTSNNSVSVLDAGGATLQRAANWRVGLDPVSLAFQPTPGDPERFLWVVNYISDNVSIIDTRIGAVVSVIEVGDRPVNILFNPTGSHAFVVCEGSPAIADPTSPGAPAPLAQEGALVAIDSATRSIVNSRWLDCHSPRAAVYDPATDRIIVAALHSGNNTTVVGRTVVHEIDLLIDGNPANPNNPIGQPDAFSSLPDLVVPFLMPSLAGPWSSEKLAPWPDPSIVVGAAPDLLERIVADAGTAGAAGEYPWSEIIDLLSTPGGTPEPAMVAEYKLQFETLWEAINPGIDAVLLNADEIIQETIDDARDTVDHDLIVVDAANPASSGGLGVVRYIGDVGATITALTRAPDGTLYLTNLDPNNITRSEPSLRGNSVNHQVVRVSGAGTPGQQVSAIDLHASDPNFGDVSAPNPAAQGISLANPSDVVMSADGQTLFVASFGVGRVARLDLAGSVLARADVGGAFGGPRSLSVDEAGRYLYALDRLNMTVTRLAVSSAQLVEQDRILLHNAEPAKTRNGRRFLYSTRFTNNYASSCSTCHVDAHLDQRAWDLGDPTMTEVLDLPHVFADLNSPCPANTGATNHAVKGPMVTLSLRGLAGRNPFHWRGDKPTFQDFNSAFVGLLGAENQLSPGEMDLYTDFINTVVYEPTWYRNRDNSFKDPGAVTGRTLYINSCHACHRLEDDGAFRDECMTEDGSLNFLGAPLFAQVEEIVQMRGLNQKFQADKYSGFGLIHDGREEREHFDHPMETFLDTFFPGIFPQSAEMIAFLDAFQTNIMPCVGEQFMWTDPGSVQQVNRLNQMIAQNNLTPRRCDVVLSGIVGGAVHGYHLSSAGGAAVFTSDTNQTLPLAQMQALVAAGTDFMVTAVPPGSGHRIGINWDLDCRPNGLDDLPLIPDGDTNEDHAVTFADITTVLANWGKTDVPVDQGDVTGEGDVNFADITRVLAFWGQVCPVVQ